MLCDGSGNGIGLSCLMSLLPLACALRMNNQQIKWLAAPQVPCFCFRATRLCQSINRIASQLRPQLGLPKDPLCHHHKPSALLALNAAEFWSDHASAPARLQPGCVACFTWSCSHPEHWCVLQHRAQHVLRLPAGVQLLQQRCECFSVGPAALRLNVCKVLCSQPCQTPQTMSLLALTWQGPAFMQASCTKPAQSSWGRGASLTGFGTAEHCTAWDGQLLQGCQLRREGPRRDADGLSGRLPGAAAGRAGGCCCLDQAPALCWASPKLAQPGWQCSSLKCRDVSTFLGSNLCGLPDSHHSLPLCSPPLHTCRTRL